MESLLFFITDSSVCQVSNLQHKSSKQVKTFSFYVQVMKDFGFSPSRQKLSMSHWT